MRQIYPDPGIQNTPAGVATFQFRRMLLEPIIKILSQLYKTQRPYRWAEVFLILVKIRDIQEKRDFLFRGNK